MVLKLGIYKITCLINDKFYIGSTVDFCKRKSRHFIDLSKNIHSNSHLQNAWNKYGKENFSFEVLEYCERENYIEREQYYLDSLLFAQEFIRKEDKRFEKLGYNICPIASTPITAGYNKKKCILYNLDGSFFKIFNSFAEADKITGCGKKSADALKTNSGKCGNYIVKSFTEDYPEKIIPYARLNIISVRGKEKLYQVNLSVRKKCLIYNLFGDLLFKCDSLAEASKKINKSYKAIGGALKSKSGKCGNFIIKPFINNYFKKIESYSYPKIKLIYKIDSFNKILESFSRKELHKIPRRDYIFKLLLSGNNSDEGFKYIYKTEYEKMLQNKAA